MLPGPGGSPGARGRMYPARLPSMHLRAGMVAERRFRSNFERRPRRPDPSLAFVAAVACSGGKISGTLAEAKPFVRGLDVDPFGSRMRASI